MQIRTLALATLGAVGAFFALAGPVLAQAGPVIAIEGETPSEWTLHDRGQMPRNQELDLLRRAAPDGDIRDWVVQGDLTPLQSDDGLKDARAELFLEIDADGRVEKCKVKESYPIAAAEGLCERLSPRVRMIPALDRTGARTADFFDVSLWLEGNLGSIPPPPRLRVRAPTVSHWPYQTVSLSVVTGGFDHLIAHPFSGGAYNGPVARVVVTPDDQGDLHCTVAHNYIDDATLSAEACPIALRGQFDFTDENAGKSAYLYFFQQDGRLAVLLPAYTREQTGQPQPDTMAEVRAGLTAETVTQVRMDFWVDVNGGIGGCTIHTTSGDDAQDFAVCDQLQRLGRFDRSLDVFGRAVSRVMIGWALPPA